MFRTSPAKAWPQSLQDFHTHSLVKHESATRPTLADLAGAQPAEKRVCWLALFEHCIKPNRNVLCPPNCLAAWHQSIVDQTADLGVKEAARQRSRFWIAETPYLLADQLRQFCPMSLKQPLRSFQAIEIEDEGSTALCLNGELMETIVESGGKSLWRQSLLAVEFVNPRGCDENRFSSDRNIDTGALLIPLMVGNLLFGGQGLGHDFDRIERPMPFALASKSFQLLEGAAGENGKPVWELASRCGQFANFSPYRRIAILRRVEVIACDQHGEGGSASIVESAR